MRKIISFCLLLTAFISSEISGQTYGNLPMGGGGFVSGIITGKTEKGLIYIRTDVGGAYRWDTLNSQWIPLLDWVSANETGYLGVESIAIDPGDPDNVYMSVGISYFNGGKSAILRSSDKGNTFSITNITSLFKVNGNGMGRNTGEKLAVDPNLGSVLFCGSRSNGLFKSTDSAATWTHVASLDVSTTSSGNGISFVLFDPSTGTSGSATQTVIIGVSETGQNLYRSDDGGSTFSPISGAPATLMPMRAALSGDRILYITYANASGPWDLNTGQIWKYNLLSGEWTNITPAGFSTPFCGISVDPANPDRLVASTINIYWSQPPTDGDRFFLSENGGTNWTDVVNHGFLYDPNGVKWNDFGKIHWAGSIEFDPFNTKKVFVTSGNGVFHTENIDSSTNVWKFNYLGLEETVPLDMISIPEGPVISVIGDYDGTRNTDINQYGPQLKPSMGTTHSIAYASLNPKVVARSGSQIYLSSDTGKTWTSINSKGTQGYLSISADGKSILHSPDRSSITYRSIDNGDTWMPVSGITYSNARTVADMVNPSVFYAYNTGSGKLLTSLDGGSHFFSNGPPGAGGSKHIRTVPGFEGHIWIALYNGGLTRSVNYGTTFSKISEVTACSAVGIGKTAPGASYPVIYIWGTIGGTEGIFMSTDEGNTWNRINDDEHEWGGPGNGQFVIGDMNDPGRTFMSTAGRGIVYAKADYMLSSESYTVAVDSQIRITPVVLNETVVTWSWSSSDTSIAKVDTTGLVTGIAPGSVTITAVNSLSKEVKTGVQVTSPVTDLNVTPLIDSVAIGEEIQLTAISEPEDVTINWLSVDPSVATVSSSGLVKGIKTGKSIISVTAGEKTVNLSLVVGVPFTGIAVDPAADTIRVNETKQLSAVFFPQNTTSDKTVTWTSGNTTVATIDSEGMVTGISVGSTVIIATTSDGTMQASCNLKVDRASSLSDASTGDFLLFPNPVKNVLNINLGDRKGNTNIKVFDSNGRLILEENTTNKNIVQLNITLESGIYFVQLRNKSQNIIKKFIVNN